MPASLAAASFPTANAYDALGRVANRAQYGLSGDRAAPAMPDFGSLLGESVQGLLDSGHGLDQKTVAMTQGKADVVDVVTAVSETEVALETMVSIRDRVIAAYEEIMRMSI